MGWFDTLNPVTYFNTMKQDVSGKPSFGKFWDSFGANDPITHGLLNSQSRLDDNVTARGLGAIGLTGPAGYFQRAADDPTQGVLHHGLAGLAYLGGSALMGGGGLGAGGAADGGSVNLFADAVPGAGGDVGASALPDVSVGTTGAGGSTATAPASGSSFNWQDLLRQSMSNNMGGGSQAQQPTNLQMSQPQQPSNGLSPHQQMAISMLQQQQLPMNNGGSYSPYQGVSSLANTALIGYLKSKNPQTYQPTKANGTTNVNGLGASSMPSSDY